MTDWLAELESISARPFPTLEEVYTDPLYFGEVDATPLQRAICRVVGGDPLGDLAEHPHVVEAIGDVAALAGKPTQCYVISGIRTGKSLLNAAVCWHGSQTVDMSRVRPGEIPRFFILATEKKTAQQTFRHVVGRGLASPILSKLIVPGSIKAESMQIRHPSGKIIEVMIAAGSESGSTVVSTWSSGCVCDEAPRWASAGESVVNLEDLRHAVMARLLPGAQFMATGSPWAPHGAVFNIVQKMWKKPTPECVVIKARGDHMNPSWWTPEKIAELQRTDPNVLLTECMAEFASPEESLFPLVAINRCTRNSPQRIEHIAGRHYRAAMDPATRGNGWTLVISTRIGHKRVIVYANEWRGTKESPLDSRMTMLEIAKILASYEIRTVYTDQWLADTLQERASELGFNVAQEKLSMEQKAKYYLAIASKFVTLGADGGSLMEIPYEPVLRTDLLRVKKRPLHGGGVAFDLPRTADGRHCDYAPSVMMSVGPFCLDEDTVPEQITPEGQAIRLGELLKKERIGMVRAGIKKANRWQPR